LVYSNYDTTIYDATIYDATIYDDTTQGRGNASKTPTPDSESLIYTPWDYQFQNRESEIGDPRV